MPKLRHFYLLGIGPCALVPVGDEELFWRSYSYLELEKKPEALGGRRVPLGP